MHDHSFAEFATQTLISEFAIDTHGYSFKVDKLGGNAAATTEFTTKVITTDTEIMQAGDSLTLVRVLRHELDHVFQDLLDSRCPLHTQFYDHKYRERAAYLDDSIFFRNLKTPDLKKMNWAFARIRDYAN